MDFPDRNEDDNNPFEEILFFIFSMEHSKMILNLDTLH